MRPKPNIRQSWPSRAARPTASLRRVGCSGRRCPPSSTAPIHRRTSDRLECASRPTGPRRATGARRTPATTTTRAGASCSAGRRSPAGRLRSVQRTEPDQGSTALRRADLDRQRHVDSHRCRLPVRRPGATYTVGGGDNSLTQWFSDPDTAVKQLQYGTITRQGDKLAFVASTQATAKDPRRSRRRRRAVRRRRGKR